MSHVTLKEGTSADQQISDIECLKEAVEKLNGVFKRGQKKFRSWATDHGKLVGDYPVPEGYTEQDIMSDIADHAIGIKDNANAYEVGVVPSRKFPGTWSLLYDFYGGALDRQFGKGLCKLQAEYQAAAIKKTASQLGDTYQEQVQPDGTKVLTIDTTVRLGV